MKPSLVIRLLMWIQWTAIQQRKSLTRQIHLLLKPLLALNLS
jgi:hypothetical protein